MLFTCMEIWFICFAGNSMESHWIRVYVCGGSIKCFGVGFIGSVEYCFGFPLSMWFTRKMGLEAILRVFFFSSYPIIDYKNRISSVWHWQLNSNDINNNLLTIYVADGVAAAVTQAVHCRSHGIHSFHINNYIQFVSVFINEFTDYGKFGRIHQAIQWNSVLGCHGNRITIEHHQARTADKEIH